MFVPVRYLWGMNITSNLMAHLFGLTVCGRESATWFGCNFMYMRLTSEYADAQLPGR